MNSPAAGTREPLRVVFPLPLDWATLHRQFRVTSTAGAVSGGIGVGRGEREWWLVPERPWPAGPHELRVGTAVEDHVGNSLARPFEVNLERSLPRAIPAAEAEVGLRFLVR